MEERRKEIRIQYSEQFLKRLKKLAKRILEKAEEREIIFRANPFDPRLETHKLHGKDKLHWAYSVDWKYRVKFLFLNDNDILYLTIGTHDEVY
ncbi:MAG: type II toxin-antitoxin system mRNA interferase toxin, RelE/StbE family [Candidatus Vogelbacteria bacterium]